MFFFFNDTATTEIYTLSLHDALPIYLSSESNEEEWIKRWHDARAKVPGVTASPEIRVTPGTFARASCQDRKSTRLNSSHDQISYAVFCLKKKNIKGQLRNAGAGRMHD